MSKKTNQDLFYVYLAISISFIFYCNLDFGLAEAIGDLMATSNKGRRFVANPHSSGFFIDFLSMVAIVISLFIFIKIIIKDLSAKERKNYLESNAFIFFIPFVAHGLSYRLLKLSGNYFILYYWVLGILFVVMVKTWIKFEDKCSEDDIKVRKKEKISLKKSQDFEENKIFWWEQEEDYTIVNHDPVKLAQALELFIAFDFVKKSEIYDCYPAIGFSNSNGETIFFTIFPRDENKVFAILNFTNEKKKHDSIESAPLDLSESMILIDKFYAGKIKLLRNTL